MAKKSLSENYRNKDRQKQSKIKSIFAGINRKIERYSGKQQVRGDLKSAQAGCAYDID